jgi:hypothetical protein
MMDFGMQFCINGIEESFDIIVLKVQLRPTDAPNNTELHAKIHHLK